MQFIITAIVAVILLVGVTSSCPSVCRCSNHSAGVYVGCSNIGLDSIPPDLPNNTYKLTLDFNDISEIEGNAFNNLPRLNRLYLHSNKITSIKSGTFTNLPNLYFLQLGNNKISVIEDNAFGNLPSLHDLYLHSNQITSIQSVTFNGFPDLYLLELYHNEISVIEDIAFNNLPSLYNVDLQYNVIQVIGENSFNNLPSLRYLKFDMYCGGCGSIPFWRWLKKNKHYSLSVTCNDYGGEYLYNLQPNRATKCFGQQFYPENEQQECTSGTYGVNCEHRCDTCVGKICEPRNGNCTYGCIEGFTGVSCKLSECTSGTFGVNCEHRCDTCVGKICEPRNGNCTYGCIEGFKGVRCNLLATSQSDTSYTTVYAAVRTFVVTALICVIIVLAILSCRRTKTNVHELERRGQTIREYQIGTFSYDSANIGAYYKEARI